MSKQDLQAKAFRPRSVGVIDIFPKPEVVYLDDALAELTRHEQRIAELEQHKRTHPCMGTDCNCDMYEEEVK